MSKLNELINKHCPNGVPFVSLKDVCRIITKQTGFDYSATIKPSLINFNDGNCYPFIQTRNFDGRNFNLNTEFYIPKNIAQQYPKLLLNEKCVLISIVGSIGNVGLYHLHDVAFLGGAICILKFLNNVNPNFVYYCLQSPIGQKQLRKKTKGSGQATVTIEDIREFKIPFPPLEVQCEIVRILDNFAELTAELTAELSLRKSQAEFYKNNLLNIYGGEQLTIKEKFERLRGTPITASKMKEIESFNGDVKIFAGGKTQVNAFKKDIPNLNLINVPAVLVQSRGLIDFIFYDKPFTFKNEMWAYTSNNVTTTKYLYYYLKNNLQFFRDASIGMGAMPQISLKVTENFPILLPNIERQRKIVDCLDKFEKLNEDIYIGLPAEIKLRQQQYEYYRNKLLTFKEADSEN